MANNLGDQHHRSFAALVRSYLLTGRSRWPAQERRPIPPEPLPRASPPKAHEGYEQAPDASLHP